jgi:acyl carrier protein
MVSEEAAAGFDRIGLGGLPLDAAFDLLEDLIAADVTQRTVATVEWQVFRPVYAGRTRSRFLDEVEAHAGTDPTEVTRPGPLGERLQATPQAQRHGVFCDYLLTQLRDILGLDESDAIDSADGFFKMGLDSFAVLELRRRLEVALGRPVPATAVFEHPTAASLASFLLKADSLPPPPASTTTTKVDDLLDRIAGLSASEVESRIEARVPRKKEYP